MANDPETHEEPAAPACSAPEWCRKPRLWYGVVVLAVLAVAAFLLVSSQPADISLSLPEFRALLGATNDTAVVQDLRGIPANDSARGGIMNCAIQASGVLSLTGKNVTNYAFDASGCYGGSVNGTRPINDCLAEINGQGRLAVTLRYNPSASRTSFTNEGAVFEGDSAFLGNCSIVGYVS